MIIKSQAANMQIADRIATNDNKLTRLVMPYLFATIIVACACYPIARAADDDIVFNTTEVRWDIAASISGTDTVIGNDENGRNDVLNYHAVTNDLDGHVMTATSDATFRPSGGGTNNGPYVGALAFGDGLSFSASGSAKYTVGLNVVEDFVRFMNIFEIDPVAVMYSAKIGGSAKVDSDLQNQNPESPVFGQVSVTASAKLKDWRGKVIHGMEMNICGVSTGSACLNAEILNSAGRQFRKQVENILIAEWRPFNEYVVDLQASGSFFTANGRDYGFTPRYSRGEFNVYADPTFQIDPNKYYELDGEMVAATDIFTLTVSQGIEYIGPTGAVIGGPNTSGDITGVIDMSGDVVPDIAQLPKKGRPRIKYFSGASREKVKTVNYLGGAWSGVAAATVRDGNGDGLDNDPAVAVLAHKHSETYGDSKHAVEVRRADDGTLIDKVFFMGPAWTVIDMAVIDDGNGDGVTGDTAIAVLGINPENPPGRQMKVQVRQLGDGVLIGNLYFFNDKWTAISLEAVNRTGQSPLLAVLANKASTGANVVQARQLSDGTLQRSTSFWDANWVAKDVAIIQDADGDGNANDPAYIVLAQHPETGRNKVQAKRVSDGERLGNLHMLGAKWNATRMAGSGDISGNYGEEAVALAEKRTDGTDAIPIKDFFDGSTKTIFP